MWSDLVINSTAQSPLIVVFMELQYLLGSALISGLLEMIVRSRIEALLDSADADSLVHGFRRMLRGVCDGDVLLSSDYRRPGSKALVVNEIFFITFTGLEPNFSMRQPKDLWQR